MSTSELKGKIRRTERELKRAEEKQRRLVNRYTELRHAKAPENIMARYRLELNGATDHINELRLQLWGLNNLSLPA